jgi:hypothetical protein
MDQQQSCSMYRIHIRPDGGDTDPAEAFAFCVKEQVLGMGWAVSAEHPNGLDWETYESLAAELYGSDQLSRVRYLHAKVVPNDLIWTRDTSGNYYIGRVLSHWEYLNTPQSRQADVVNVVRCDLRQIPIDEVPGKVVACFRAPRAIQAISDSVATTYSRMIWNKVTNTNQYTVGSIPQEGLFSLLGSETVEDVVFIYLQLRGWLVVPHSRKIDTMGFEYLVIERNNGTRAAVQVKTGDTPLSPSDYAGLGKVFLFQANGRYLGVSTNDVECLEPHEMLVFIADNLKLMPGVVQRWFGQLAKPA